MNARQASETLTVMFIDIVGYTSTTNELSRDQFNSLHNIFDELCYPIFVSHFGTVVKKIGDAFLITFKSPTNAVQCGIALQRTFEQYRKRTGNPLQIRVAIHTGEVLKRGKDVYGETVNTAARIEGIVKPDHIVFSESVFFAMNKTEVPYIHLGQKFFKGLKYPVRLFRVETEEDEQQRIRKIISTSLLILLLVGALSVVIFFVITAALPLLI